MNTGEHITAPGEHVGDEQDGRNLAHKALCTRLRNGLASSRLNVTELAGVTRLGRTTVSQALNVKAKVPSAQTVVALARALKLPATELLELQREAAVASIEDEARPGPGRPIGQWDPHDLEVHPAGPASTASGSGTGGRTRELPGYVQRGHDLVLAEAVQAAAAGRSQMVVLVGSSSTGKTRACWEAVQPLAAHGWRLWHPIDPTRADAALDDLRRVAPRTVVWLNEAQHYLGRTAGERVTAALKSLLTAAERGPVLVLGTLWPEYAAQYTSLPSAGQDPHSLVRELLSGRTVTVPDAFDAQAMAAAAVLARGGDRLLADALTRTGPEGRLTQDLAGAPALLTRYEHATPAARAVLEAAMDARRLGTGPHLHQAFLTDAATDYLSAVDYDQLAQDWAEQAFAELARLVHGKQAPLRRTTLRSPRRPHTPSPPVLASSPQPTGPVFRLADYLEQHGRTTRSHLCPPASFWDAAYTHLTHPDDLDNLTQAATDRHRLQWAHYLRTRAADHGSIDALTRLATEREQTEDPEGAETLARQAFDHGNTRALYQLVEMRNKTGDPESAEALARRTAAHGNPHLLAHLAWLREQAGDREHAGTLYQEAADHGESNALTHVAIERERAGDREGAETLARQAVGHGSTHVMYRLVEMRNETGDREGAEALARQTAAHGDSHVLAYLAQLRRQAGDLEHAEALYQEAADHHDTEALTYLAEKRERAGDREAAETLYREAADHGHIRALTHLAELREQAGDQEAAENLARQAADHGDPFALTRLVAKRAKVGGREAAEVLARQTADHGDTQLLTHLATERERAGDHKGAKSLYREAADHGDTHALSRLAELRERAGDPEGAESLARQAADHGDTLALARLAEMREWNGNREGAEAMAQLAAHHGETRALIHLATERERDGDREGAERAAQQAADHGSTRALYLLAEKRVEARQWEAAERAARQAIDRGNTRALYLLAVIREKAGDRIGAKTRYREAANHGHTDASFRTSVLPEGALTRLWPYGLDPDGAATPPWS
ncbi:hypothetical protein [Streptomyces sp. Tue6028]|uniref:hypothetical protein n=1 Tax=Streptomyces sp. Tue6028 TaxID=2036037 RepID=UPI003D730765